jgi:FAD:protein FMN transferase
MARKTERTLGTVSVRALGTTATAVLAEPDALLAARSILLHDLRALDLAASRFREDSELQHANRNAGHATPVGGLFWTALAAALDVARKTDGLVDPTVGAAMRGNGYDATFSRVALQNGSLVASIAPAGRWREIELDPKTSSVLVPSGIELDLGASAKALGADLIARRIEAETGSSTLVSLGGDVSVAGEPPEGGWVVGIDDDHSTPVEAAAERVAIENGGLASSGIRVRRWRTADGEAHHILDPRTGRPARSPWSTVTVAAASCLDANAASTAAIVLGERAPSWLAERALPARLARLDGTVVRVAGWPAAERAAA